MKKNNLLLLCIFLTIIAHAQINLEKVKIHDLKFKAKEVCGQSRFFGAPDYYRTDILNPLITKRNSDYYYSLGSYRRHQNRMETLDLFNLSLQNNDYPFLDSIDFEYYRSYGINSVEQINPEFLSEPDYVKLKSYLVDSMHLSIHERKRILFSSKEKYRVPILMSRYEIITNEFTIDKKKVTQATAELRAQLDTITISSNAELSAKVHAYFMQLADESINVKGYYIDCRLHAAYIDKINFYIRNTPKIHIGNDQFAFNLKNYIMSEDAAANTSLVAIQLDGSYNKTKVNVDAISADLSSKFQIPVDDAVRIAASVNASFTKTETVTFKNKFNNTFIIRYFTSSIIDDIQFADKEFIESKFVQ